MAVGSIAVASDVGYFASQSPFTDSQRAKVGIRIDPSNKISLSYASSKAKTALEDPNSSNIKLSYRYGRTGETSFTTDLRVSDEAYFFNGKGLNFKSNFPVGEATRMTLGFGAGVKTYSKSSSEFLGQGDIQLGFDHEVSEAWSLGLDIGLSKFASTSQLLRQALQGKTLTNSDLETYVGLLSKDSTIFYMEYSLDDWIIGLSAGVDHFLIDGSRNTIVDLYTDYSFGRWTISAAYARSRSDFNSTVTSTTTLGLSFGF